MKAKCQCTLKTARWLAFLELSTAASLIIIVVLGCKTPEIIITSFHPNECTGRYTEEGEKGARIYGSVRHDLLFLRAHLHLCDVDTHSTMVTAMWRCPHSTHDNWVHEQPVVVLPPPI